MAGSARFKHHNHAASVAAHGTAWPGSSLPRPPSLPPLTQCHAGAAAVHRVGVRRGDGAGLYAAPHRWRRACARCTQRSAMQEGKHACQGRCGVGLRCQLRACVPDCVVSRITSHPILWPVVGLPYPPLVAMLCMCTCWLRRCAPRKSASRLTVTTHSSKLLRTLRNRDMGRGTPAAGLPPTTATLHSQKAYIMACTAARECI